MQVLVIHIKRVVHKLWLLKYSFILVIVVSVTQIIVDTCHYDIIEVSPVITSLVAGVIFAIAVIYSGILIDYKENEKIPGDLSASLMRLYQDSCMIPTVDPKTVQTFKTIFRDLHEVFVRNFRSSH